MLDNAFTLDTLISKYVYRKKGKVYIAFIDFQKAYDQISWDKLWQKRLMKGWSIKMVQFPADMYEGTYFSVKVSPGRGSMHLRLKLEPNRAISYLHFCLFCASMILLSFKYWVNPPANIGDKRIHCLLNADVIVVISLTPIGLSYMLSALKSYLHWIV